LKYKILLMHIILKMKNQIQVIDKIQYIEDKQLFNNFYIKLLYYIYNL
jgi:hypothetical protein